MTLPALPDDGVVLGAHAPRTGVPRSGWRVRR